MRCLDSPQAIGLNLVEFIARWQASRRSEWAAARDLVEKHDCWLKPPGASEAELKTRALANLRNQRPAWLAHCHAVLAAYGWPADLADDELLARLLTLNQARAAAGGTG